VDKLTQHQRAIGGDPVTFGQHQGIPANHFAAGDTPSHAITDNQCAGTREIAQRCNGALRLALLVQRDTGNEEDKAE